MKGPPVSAGGFFLRLAGSRRMTNVRCSLSITPSRLSRLISLDRALRSTERWSASSCRLKGISNAVSPRWKDSAER